MNSFEKSEGDWKDPGAMPRPGRKRRRILIGLAILAAACIAVVLWAGTGLISPANRDVGRPPADFPATEYTFTSKSGAMISAWYAEAANANATVILLHPLRQSRNYMLDRAKFLLDAGYSVLLIDLQAHGESLNDNITFGYLEKYDIQAAVADVRKKHPDHKIAIIGNSIGGAAAILGSPLEVDAMVLESVYPTLEKNIYNRVQKRVGVEYISQILTQLLTWQIKPRLGIDVAELRPIDKIGDVGCPVLILAGQMDPRTTIEDSRNLFAAAKEPKEMEVFEAAKNENFHRFEPEKYQQLVLVFLNKCAPSRAAGAEPTLPD